jgi:hypothetical protein
MTALNGLRGGLLATVACSAALCVAAAATAQPTFVEQGAAILGGANVEGRSASLADIDNDGDLDLFFQGGSGARRLYRNNVVGTGALTFTNVSSAMLPSGLGDSWSAAWADYNGDGRIDVFVGQTNSGAAGDVLRNNRLAFSNESVPTGLDDPGFHQNVAWNDIDRDRDLDLIIGMEGPEKHEIYLQGPSGSFTPVGAAVGVQADVGTKGYGLAIGDTDGDGDLDMYFSTCRSDNNIRNNFYKNMLMETGSLGFVDIADSNGTQNFRNTYGAEFHDFDDDGDLDLFVVGADRQPTKIYRNDGGNMFTDVDITTGRALLADVGGDFNGARPVDYDNDGDLDLFFHDHLAAGGKNYARMLYRNDGNWTFTNVTIAEGLHAANEGGYDSTWGDIDLDGDQDLIGVTAGFNANDDPLPERVFVSNSSTNGNHWLYVRLAGPNENTTGIGATLYATIDEGTPQERTLRREANTNAGTFNQSDLPVHFGLGAAAEIDELRIVWPDGTEQLVHDVAVDRYLTLHTPGDFNGDGVVDASDLAQWQADFAESDDSDANLDGASDGADFLQWQRQLGNGASAGALAVTVPELNGQLLAAAMVAAIARISRPRGSGCRGTAAAFLCPAHAARVFAKTHCP